MTDAGTMFDGRLVMAPMTRGTDLPFRRLVASFGAGIVLGEMAYAHKVVRRERSELALVRRHPDERVFGVQLAGKRPDVMAEAARIAADAGADFVDVNLGCPIDDATRRGFGAALLQRPSRVAAIVAAMKAAVTIPVTVKLRLGWSSEKPTFLKIARAARDAGVDAITLHARSRAQRYRRPADWERVAELCAAVPDVPVIGNGDVFHWSEARRRIDETGCAGVMIGRWALAKPWIFREHALGRDEDPTAEERLAILRRYAELCLELLGDDEHGRRRARRFVVFHQDFFSRYRAAAGPDAVNSDDPRDWGRPPDGELEGWLARSDLAGAEALAGLVVDGAPEVPPPVPETFRRAVKTAAYG